MLKNRNGKPYNDKATISKITKKLKSKVVKTRWGFSRSISEKELKKMIQPNDPRIKDRGEQFKKMWDENPHRDWKFNLTPEQIVNLEKLQIEQEANKTETEIELEKIGL